MQNRELINSPCTFLLHDTVSLWLTAGVVWHSSWQMLCTFALFAAFVPGVKIIDCGQSKSYTAFEHVFDLTVI